jgi:hypothetical protein
MILIIIIVCTGIAWQGFEEGQFLQRISLFFVSYAATNIWLIEIAPGLHEEKLLFYRERHAKATSNLASWIAMGFPLVLSALFFTLVFSIPVYCISGLRTGSRNFFSFFFAMYLGMISNLCLQYLLAMSTPNSAVHSLFFPGLLVPIKVSLLIYTLLLLLYYLL